MLCCPHPTKIWKLGRSVGIFFFFLRTVRELSFPIYFFKFLNGENSGGMQSKRIYKSCKCFLSHWIQILANSSPKSDIKKKKKKKTTLFFRILRSVGRGQHNNFFFWPNEWFDWFILVLVGRCPSGQVVLYLYPVGTCLNTCQADSNIKLFKNVFSFVMPGSHLVHGARIPLSVRPPRGLPAEAGGGCEICVRIRGLYDLV